MGQTIVEKIVARHVGRDVVPGEYVQVSSRIPLTMGMNSGGRSGPVLERLGAKGVFDPNMIRLVDGHTGSTASHNAGEHRAAARRFGKQMGIPIENIFELGRNGVEHVVSCDNAWGVPGEIFFNANNNGHTTTLGALGSFAFPLTVGSNGYLATGKTWIKVPKSVKIVVNGKLPKGVIGRDVSEYVLGQIGPSVSAGTVMEWTGEVIDDMSIDGRFTIACNALFFGAWTTIMNPDQKTLDYVKERNPQAKCEPLYSDADATYFKTFEFDLSNIEPQIVPPPDRFYVDNVAKHEGKAINRGFIGSCENGRIEDLRLAAQVLKGRKIHPDVILNITPATYRIYKEALKEGLIEIFADAECAIHSPCCGQCWGANTPLAAGDVCIAASTCNYPGRMGSRDAEIYLANPATIAASAIEGKITDPRKYL